MEGALAAGASASVEGTIQNVTYKDEKSGYTVLKVAALHTAGAPPEQRRSAAQRQSRPINGKLYQHGIPYNLINRPKFLLHHVRALPHEN